MFGVLCATALVFARSTRPSRSLSDASTNNRASSVHRRTSRNAACGVRVRAGGTTRCAIRSRPMVARRDCSSRGDRRGIGDGTVARPDRAGARDRARSRRVVDHRDSQSAAVRSTRREASSRTSSRLATASRSMKCQRRTLPLARSVATGGSRSPARTRRVTLIRFLKTSRSRTGRTSCSRTGTATDGSTRIRVSAISLNTAARDTHRRVPSGC